MNEDVAQIIKELMILYDDCKPVIAKFENAYNTLVPDRYEPFVRNYQMNHYGMLETVKPAPKPQHPQLDELLRKNITKIMHATTTKSPMYAVRKSD